MLMHGAEWGKDVHQEPSIYTGWWGLVTLATHRVSSFLIPWIVTLATIRASFVTWHHWKWFSRHHPYLRDLPNTRGRAICQHHRKIHPENCLHWEACQISGKETDNETMKMSTWIWLSPGESFKTWGVSIWERELKWPSPGKINNTREHWIINLSWDVAGYPGPVDRWQQANNVHLCQFRWTLLVDYLRVRHLNSKLVRCLHGARIKKPINSIENWCYYRERKAPGIYLLIIIVLITSTGRTATHCPTFTARIHRRHQFV